MSVCWNASSGGAGYYFELLSDDSPADNKLSMMLCYNTDRNLSGSTMLFQFSDLTTPKSVEETAAIEKLPPRNEPGTPGDEYDYDKLAAAGNWSIEFPLNYTDVSTTVKPDAAIRLYGGECKVKELRYSPLSVSLTIKGESIEKHDRMPPALSGAETEPGSLVLVSQTLAPAEGFDGTTEGDLVVTLKDGATVPTNGTGTSIVGKTLTVTSSFSTLIKPADIKSVSYNGVTIPLP